MPRNKFAALPHHCVGNDLCKPLKNRAREWQSQFVLFFWELLLKSSYAHPYKVTGNKCLAEISLRILTFGIKRIQIKRLQIFQSLAQIVLFNHGREKLEKESTDRLFAGQLFLGKSRFNFSTERQQ